MRRCKMFEIIHDIIQAHMQIDKYYAYVIQLDIVLAVIFVSLFYTVYMTWRKQLRVRDLIGTDDWIGLIMGYKKCKRTPNGEPAKFVIKFRRRSWQFWADLIKLQHLYYQPPEKCEKPIEMQLRKAYIQGERLEYHQNPSSQFHNYYYLHQGQGARGKYEESARYIEQGDHYNVLTTRSVQIAVQADSELAARAFHIDTVAIQIPGLDIPEVDD